MHTDRDGVIRPLYALTDEHIEGIINMLFNKFKDAKERLSSNKNNFLDIMYPGNELELEEAEERILHFEEAIAPYIYEATLRDINSLDEIRIKLWHLLERDGMSEKYNNNQNSLLEYNVD